MKILGLTVDVPSCSSAVLIENGSVICGAPEERFNREKFSMKFPSRAISFCLNHRQIEFKDIDAIAISWNPLINICETTSARLTSTNRHRGEMLYTVPGHLMRFIEGTPDHTKQVIGLGNDSQEIYYVNHHNCHAAGVFYESRFRDAVILTCDGYGEKETVTVSQGSNNRISRCATTYFPHSIGMFYGTITEYLGFSHDSDEWKVMALGAYGGFNRRIYEKLAALFEVTDDLTIRMDTRLFEFNNQLSRGMYNGALAEYLGVPERQRNLEFRREHYDLAFAAQKVFEDVLLDLCGRIQRRFKNSNLCLSGGSFMNSVFNGKLAHSGLFKNIYIPFAPNDAGGAAGAALWTYHNILGREIPAVPVPTTPYLGPAYSDQEIERSLRLFKCSFKRRDNIEEIAANLLAQGNVIGWFQGAMEFGERALGNRSILADARDPNAKERVNAAIKFREGFRPFAPSVLEEKAQELFLLPERNSDSRYMEKVFEIRNEKARLLPGITHADGSGRLQTVSQEANPRYYRLIQEFENLSGLPVILNTSFNRNGEPIVCSPEDALAVFFGSGLDALVMGNYLVCK